MGLLMETGRIDLNKLPVREDGRTLLQRIYDMKRIPTPRHRRAAMLKRSARDCCVCCWNMVWTPP